MSMSSLKRRGSLRTECGWVTDEASEMELWTKSLKWTLSIHCETIKEKKVMSNSFDDNSLFFLPDWCRKSRRLCPASMALPDGRLYPAHFQICSQQSAGSRDRGSPSQSVGDEKIFRWRCSRSFRSTFGSTSNSLHIHLSSLSMFSQKKVVVCTIVIIAAVGFGRILDQSGVDKRDLADFWQKMELAIRRPEEKRKKMYRRDEQVLMMKQWDLVAMMRVLEKRKHCRTSPRSPLPPPPPRPDKLRRPFWERTFSLTMCNKLPVIDRQNLSNDVLDTSNLQGEVPWRTKTWVTSIKMSQPSTIIRSIAKHLRMFSVSLTYRHWPQLAQQSIISLSFSSCCIFIYFVVHLAR